MEVRLDGKTALVTGGSKGIGRAIAQEFALAGARVMLSSRKQDALEKAVMEIRELGGDADFVVAHAGNPEQAEAAVAATIERYHACDILVNNAATNPYLGPTLGIELAQYDKTWNVNFRGPLIFSQKAHEFWMGEHGGVILNIASIGGLISEGFLGMYNATKAALMHLTRTLAGELAPSVRVNAIAPGLVKTDMARALWAPNEERIAASFPLQRLGEPEDIAQSAVFLVSEKASWITGHTMIVDGGAMVGSR